MPKKIQKEQAVAVPRERHSATPEQIAKAAQERARVEQAPQAEHEKVPQKQEEGFIDETIEALKNKLRKNKKKTAKLPQRKDNLTIQIEQVMEEGLKDAYQELTPLQKQKFKLKGEEVALKIRSMLNKSRVKVKNVFKLLIEWLKMLPGITSFYAEQEAKIKADSIMRFHRKK